MKNAMFVAAMVVAMFGWVGEPVYTDGNEQYYVYDSLLDNYASDTPAECYEYETFTMGCVLYDKNLEPGSRDDWDWDGNKFYITK
jgi:hypothetical protein